MQALSSCMKSRGFPRPPTGLRRDGVGPWVLARGTRIACPQDLPREQQPSRLGVLNTREKGAQQQRLGRGRGPQVLTASPALLSFTQRGTSHFDTPVCVKPECALHSQR